MNKEFKMIQISKNFQTSVNIAYDLHDKEKIKNFIPTTESIFLIEELFESVNSNSVNRAHILIGSYGKGKSHIILETLNLLFEKDKKLFTRVFTKIKEQNPGLFEDINNYLESERKILPVIINGSSTSLSQAFLFSLYSTLKQNNLERFMPDTNFKSAINTIQNWKEKFPLTYSNLKEKLPISINDFINRLESFDFEAYEEFERIYPEITSGSVFNPFANYDIVELYENVSKKLSASNEGWCGLFVIYDEFSKYLESSISKASINDIKLLQDFAEKCGRASSAGNKNQLHLLLISHKEFSNYIDSLPKEKVDGWKGVSERFKHIVLNSDYSQIYEVIGEVLQKDSQLWKKFLLEQKSFFEDESERKTNQKMFGFNSELCDFVCKNCYPLSPATSYILPRLSEKIAQNERTMFTFLAGSEKTSLPSLLENLVSRASTTSNVKNTIVETEPVGAESVNRHCEQSEAILPHIFGPDVLFDYFENQLRSENYTSPIKKIYSTAKKCLEAIQNKSLEAKIIKTLCLIYCLEQFERLSPTIETLADIFITSETSWKNINEAIENLTNRNLLYKSRSNDFLILKENLNVDLNELILNTIEKRKHKISEIEILNSVNSEKILYPIEYNVKNDMTRYFTFTFCMQNELLSSLNTKELVKNADGIVIGIIHDKEETDKNIKKITADFSKKILNSCMIVLKKNNFSSIVKDLRTLDAVDFLKTENQKDKILCDELNLIQNDLLNSVQKFIQGFTHPENDKSYYFALGKEQKIFRRANFDELLSKICSECFTNTPLINNESLNKNILTGAADKSRRILIDAILSSEEENLGISGGQELSFMRSALCVPGILKKNHAELLSTDQPTVWQNKMVNSASMENRLRNKFEMPANQKHFDTTSEKIDKNFRNLFCIINEFIDKAKIYNNASSQDKNEAIPFENLVQKLSSKEYGIGLRKGVIPIYLAVALSKIKRNVVIKNNTIEVPLDSNTLCALTENPKDFTLSVVDFDKPKEIYIKSLCKMFDEFPLKEQDFEKITYSKIVNLMLDWYRALPKYSREKRKNTPRPYITFMNELKNAVSQSQKFLFVKIPNIFESSDFADSLIQKIETLKKDYENYRFELENDLAQKTKNILGQFISNFNENDSLCALYKKFYEKLENKNPEIINHKFENSAENLFVIFANCGNDEIKLVKSLAIFLTGINTEDWNDSTNEIYEKRLNEFIKTLNDYAENKNALGIVVARSVVFGAVEQQSVSKPAKNNGGESRNHAKPDLKVERSETERKRPNETSEYKILFADEENTLHFDKVECSQKAKSLEAELRNIFSEYGQSISVGEKRQVLMDVLKEFCK